MQDMVEALPRAKKHFFFSLLPAAQAGCGSALTRWPQIPQAKPLERDSPGPASRVLEASPTGNSGWVLSLGLDFVWQTQDPQG